MQILEIILFNENGKRRILSFKPGKVNIIVGDSKTGKTAIIDIVDYCLGSSDFKVAEGIVREYVWWFAVRFQLKQGQIIIARPNPNKYERSSSDVYFVQGDIVKIPNFQDLKSNINTDILLQKLANIIGIEEYIHQADGFTRPETPVTFKHSRFYCFQPQTDIDQRDFLFYNQKKDAWNEQAMKDTLPYFLGAVATENVKLVRQLAEKKRNLNRLNRELKDAQAIVDKTMGIVFELVNEAKQVGLIQMSQVAKDRDDGIKILQTLSEIDTIQESSNAENEVLIELQTKRSELTKKLDGINQTIKDTENYQKETSGYENESTLQASRLESIDLFPKIKNSNNSICPLCDQELETKIPTIEQIKQSLYVLQSNIEVTRKEKPKLKQYLDDLQKQKSALSAQVQELEKSITGIYKEKAQAQKLKDLNIRKGRVLGRISLYLESKTEISDFSNTKQKLSMLDSEIAILQQQLSLEEKEDRLESILDQLSVQMTSWAKELEMEFMDRTIKFDIKKLTLFIISPDRKIRFDHTGSGENWVAYHILLHYALHKFFILNKRPVPNFLILDQLSQSNSSSGGKINNKGEIEKDEDDKTIERFFDFILKRTNELDGGLQSIVIDHERRILENKRFAGLIIERWKKEGLKLVPTEWITVN